MTDKMTDSDLSGASEGEKSRTRRFGFAHFFRTYGTFGILLLLVLLSSTQSDVFLTERNATNLLRQMSFTGVMAIGMLFVVLTRGIDLSVGSIAALGAVTSAIFMQEMPVFPAILLATAVGAACGAISGVLIAFLRLPAFVITLAMMTGARGLALIISGGQPVMLGPAGAELQSFSTTLTFGLPNPALLMILLFGLAFLVLNFSRFGRLVKAIGSNDEAVRLSGVSVPWYVASVYVISGALAALAGILLAGRSGVGSAQIGVAAELDVIAAVVIGGASLMGGRGGVVNTFIGVMVLGVIGNIMNLAGVPGYHQQVYLGAIIIAAVTLQHSAQIFRR